MSDKQTVPPKCLTFDLYFKVNIENLSNINTFYKPTAFGSDTQFVCMHVLAMSAFHENRRHDSVNVIELNIHIK